MASDEAGLNSYMDRGRLPLVENSRIVVGGECYLPEPRYFIHRPSSQF
jgi:hypothetical protein